MRRALTLAAATALLIGVAAPAAQAQADPPDDVHKPGYEFCGWYAHSDGYWTYDHDDPNTYGVYLLSYARGMSCDQARNHALRAGYRSKPPYAPTRPGYRCQRLGTALEFSDARCVKRGKPKVAFRWVTGA